MCVNCITYFFIEMLMLKVAKATTVNLIIVSSVSENIFFSCLPLSK